MRAEYIRLQEEQLSYFSPHYSEFSRFTDGLKHISSPRCLPPISPGDTTKIDNNFESCTIVSCFFVFSAKISECKHNGKSFSVLFGLWLAGMGKKYLFCKHEKG